MYVFDLPSGEVFTHKCFSAQKFHQAVNIELFENANMTALEFHITVALLLLMRVN
jgi:hypothetical protein